MGEKVTLQEAMQIANISKPTIFTWLRKHYITEYRDKRRIYVDRDEIETFAALRTVGEVAPPHQVWSVLMRKVEALEKQVEVLLYLQNLRDPLEVTDEHIALLYDAAVDLTTRKLALTDVQEFLVALGSLTEATLESLIYTRQKPHAWVIFHLVADRCMRYLREYPGFKTCVEKQQLYLKFEAQRARLRDIALIFIEADPDSAAREVYQKAVGVTSTLESELLRTLAARYGRDGNRRKPTSKKDHEEVGEVARFLQGKDSDIRSSWGAAQVLRSVADRLERESKV